MMLAWFKRPEPENEDLQRAIKRNHEAAEKLRKALSEIGCASLGITERFND